MQGKIESVAHIKMDNKAILQKIKFIMFIVLILSILQTTKALDDEPKMVFNNWVAPYRSISILGEDFYLADVSKDPSMLVIEARNSDEDKIILRENQAQAFQGYLFETKAHRFDLDKIHIKGEDGMPWYGEIMNSSRKILHSYHLQAKLIKPILEFNRTINDKHASRLHKNNIEVDINAPIKIRLNIMNHGIAEVDFRHKEHIPNSFEILNYSSDDLDIFTGEDKKGRFIELRGKTKELNSMEYTLYTDNDSEFTFDSEAQLEYNDRTHVFGERNITQLVATSSISIWGGFHNGRGYLAKETQKEIGEQQPYGVIIENEREEEIKDVSITIEFPDNNPFVYYNGRRLSKNKFQEIFDLGIDEKKVFAFNISIFDTGVYEIPATIITNVNDKEKIERVETKANIVFYPLEPNIIFNTTKENRVTDATIYLMNSNKKDEFRNLKITVISNFGEETDQYEYDFGDISINSLLLINRFSEKIRNSTKDYIKVKGSFNTAYGETINFSSRISPEEGYKRDYYKRMKEIVNKGNLDLRYENLVIESEMPKFVKGLLLITGMVVNEESGANIYILPIIILIVFIIIQTIIAKRNDK
ncbi:MAG: hypothetical protein ACOCUR_00025 [Nanoarchaeota archaeon]